MDKIIIINKEKGYTSRDVVNILCKKFNTKRVGHTGTLDPLATGVLIVCINKATKLVDILTSFNKEYVASIELGTLTDTLDSEGTVIKEEQLKNITKANIEAALNSFIGEYNQEVPIYSAVKVKGRKLYECARSNQEVKLPVKPVTIYSLKLISDISYNNNNKVTFDICTNVSKGTYIRSLIRDIAKKLNTIGIMTDLVRTKQGDFDIKNSYTLEQVENNDFNTISIDKILKDYNKIIVSEHLESKILNGAIIKKDFEGENVVYINNKNEVLAIYKTYNKDKLLAKPHIMFKTNENT